MHVSVRVSGAVSHALACACLRVRAIAYRYHQSLGDGDGDEDALCWIPTSFFHMTHISRVSSACATRHRNHLVCRVSPLSAVSVRSLSAASATIMPAPPSMTRPPVCHGNGSSCFAFAKKKWTCCNVCHVYPPMGAVSQPLKTPHDCFPNCHPPAGPLVGQRWGQPCPPCSPPFCLTPISGRAACCGGVGSVCPQANSMCPVHFNASVWKAHGYTACECSEAVAMSQQFARWLEESAEAAGTQQEASAVAQPPPPPSPPPRSAMPESAGSAESRSSAIAGGGKESAGSAEPGSSAIDGRSKGEDEDPWAGWARMRTPPKAPAATGFSSQEQISFVVSYPPLPWCPKSSWALCTVHHCRGGS